MRYWFNVDTGQVETDETAAGTPPSWVPTTRRRRRRTRSRPPGPDTEQWDAEDKEWAAGGAWDDEDHED